MNAPPAPSTDGGGDPACWAGLVGDQRDRPDLDTPTHVHDAVIAFYREVALDDLLAPVFGEVAEVDWAEHIPRLIDYWCRIVLDRPGYRGQVMAVHRHLHELEPLRPEHCDRWYRLWVATIDDRWAGPRAERAKGHAASLMAGMAGRIFGFAWSPEISPRR